MLYSALALAPAVVVYMGPIAFGQLEWIFTIMMKWLDWLVANSMYTHCQGTVGHDHGNSGAAGGAFLVLKHCLQVLAVSSMSLSMFGHHTWLRAVAFMHTTPGCDLCSSLRICSSREGGMTVHRPHIRQPCSMESLFLWKKSDLSLGMVQKWVGQPFWVINGALARTWWQAVSHAIFETDTKCLLSCAADTQNILSSTLGSLLYCRGSLRWGILAYHFSRRLEFDLVLELVQEQGLPLKACSCQNGCGWIWHENLKQWFVISSKLELAPKQVHVVFMTKMMAGPSFSIWL